MNLNKAIVAGRLARDPEKRSTDSGLSVTNFPLATSNYYKDKSGENQEQTEFHDIVFFGRTADVAAQYLKKGALALVEGRIQTRSWEDKEGNKRYRTEIIGERLQLGPRGDTQAPGKESQEKKDSKNEGKENTGKDIPVIDEDDEIDVEDIPF